LDVVILLARGLTRGPLAAALEYNGDVGRKILGPILGGFPDGNRAHDDIAPALV
jgi:hypothetical protein